MINGKLLKDAMMSAAISIANKKRSVDELNVYPVPDGDTGTNMSMTMGAALRALELMGEDVTVSQVADTAASALLRGARGNSGVILSLLFRGIAKGLNGLTEADCESMANALELGVSAAYKAVMKPTEGTILTVARMASVKAQECVHTTNDPVILWEEVCKEAEATLAKTPDMLPVLKKAGVVDAGGQGLLLIFQAMLEVFHGGSIAVPAEKAKEEKKVEFSTAVGEFDEVINFTYCTEFIVQKHPDSPDASKLRAYLETIGDCVVVVDDEEIIKVHVHTDSPGMALTKALEFGCFINDPKPKIENMRIQHENKVLEAKITKQQEFRPAEQEKEFGFVAVAAGRGVESMFTDLGVDQVVRGGQTMNPSTDDILKAIMATPAKTVFVLPNNKNIIMAAEQAQKLADRQVIVLPTRTVPMGITALLNFDPSANAETNTINMMAAADKVSTGLITYAARDSEFDGKRIRKGEIMALENGKIVATSTDLTKATYRLARSMCKKDSSFVTIISGCDVSDEEAEKLTEIVKAKCPNHVEVSHIRGGQPVYYYMISVE